MRWSRAPSSAFALLLLCNTWTTKAGAGTQDYRYVCTSSYQLTQPFTLYHVDAVHTRGPIASRWATISLVTLLALDALITLRACRTAITNSVETNLVLSTEVIKVYSMFPLRVNVSRKAMPHSVYFLHTYVCTYQTVLIPHQPQMFHLGLVVLLGRRDPTVEDIRHTISFSF